MDEMLIVGIVAIAVFAVVMVCIFVKIVGYQKMIGTYFFNYRGHEIGVAVASRKISLRIDGTLMDERKVLNVYVCTLHAALGGVNIQARVDGRLWRMCVGVTADGVSLPLERRGR